MQMKFREYMEEGTGSSPPCLALCTQRMRHVMRSAARTLPYFQLTLTQLPPFLAGAAGGISEIGKTSAHLSLVDIAAQMSAVKEASRQRKAAAKPYKYIPPGGWKEPDADWIAALPPGKVRPSAVRAAALPAARASP